MRFSLTFLFLAAFFSATSQDGIPDPSFGTDGKVFYSMPGVGTSVDVPNNQRIVVLPNQKILHCFTYNTGTETDFGIVRYNSDGSLDNSFGGDGIITTDIGDDDLALSMIVGANGKIIVGGRSETDFAVVRYNSDGSLDNSFGGDGIVTTDFSSGFDQVNSVNIQSSTGKIIAAGFTFGTSSSFALVRYNDDGNLDGTFGTAGRVTTVITSGAIDQVNATVIQTDGKIIAAGVSDDFTTKRFALARYTANGTLDNTFDSDGRLTTTIANGAEAYAVTLQTNNRIIAAGYSVNASSNNDFTIVRYTTSGGLDNTFDGDGIAIKTFLSGKEDIAYAVAMQGDGKIVVAGYSENNTPDKDFVVTRLESNGTTDGSFGGIGYRLIDFGGEDYGYSIGSQGNNLIIGGSTGISLALTRLINSSPILPLKIESFTAVKHSSSVEVKWQTSYEQNYEVERSNDANNFNKIGVVYTNGSSNGLKDYALTDLQPSKGINYYRIKVVHTDGSILYSRMLTVQFNSAITKLHAYPNPVTDVLNIQLTSTDRVINLQLTDISLKVIKSIQLNTNGNGVVTSIDMNSLPKGIYFIKVNEELIKIVKN
jgi:uncharacterized delta-60 repeat protein